MGLDVWYQVLDRHMARLHRQLALTRVRSRKVEAQARQELLQQAAARAQAQGGWLLTHHVQA